MDVESSRQTLTRLTLDADIDLNPMWTRDARRVIFSSARAGVYNLYALDINRAGSEVRLTRSANTQLPDSVTADGAFVILHEVRPGSGSDIDRFPLQPGQASAPASGERLVHGPSDEWNGEVSPDGSLLAFQSGESDQAEVYVCPYPDVARARWQLSSGGGQEPAWTRGGREPGVRRRLRATDGRLDRAIRRRGACRVANDDCDARLRQPGSVAKLRRLGGRAAVSRHPAGR